VARGGSLLAVYALLLASAPGAPQAQQPAPPLDVDYVPTPPEVVEAMLKLARVTSADVVYDLGSGDGRIPIAAAKSYGARAVGIDIAAERVAEATANAVAGGVAGKVTFLKQDLFTAAIGDATVVTLYLLPELNLKLLPKLNRELKPGTRVVSHAFDMGDTIKPRQTMNVGGRTIHLFVVPIR
jgi:SAM-dependent methyltransferase